MRFRFKRVIFIGGGNMAQALISAFSNVSLQLHVVEVNIKTQDFLRNSFKRLVVHTTFPDKLNRDDLLILAVKPQVMSEVCSILEVGESTVVSVAAGVSFRFLEDALGTNQIFRAMPNLAAKFSLGVIGLLVGKNARLKEEVIEMFKFAGKVIVLDSEAQINALTAVSGSGTAYVMYFIEALIDAAQIQGFDRRTAVEVSIQTFSGAMELLNRSGLSVMELRSNVTSTGGTTAAAISSMEEDSLKAIVAKAVNKAYQRALELEDGK